MIPKEIYEKYHLADITEYETESDFYETFLTQTDFIPNKILEQLIENFADASALNFISVFIKFIADVRVNYNDILKYRKYAREEINRLEGETVPAPETTTTESETITEEVTTTEEIQ